MILVTGATGKFGGSTAHYLQENHIPFIAAAKHADKLQQHFGKETGRVAFDWDDPGTFAFALEQITVVSLMPPPVVTKDFHVKATPFVKAAKAAGVQHIVLTSALYSDEPDSMFYHTEALVKEAGIDYTIIRPSFVFQNFLLQFLDAIRAGVIISIDGDSFTSTDQSVPGC